MSTDALFQLGMGLDAPKTAQKEDIKSTQPALNDASQVPVQAPDFFIEKDGILCAGSHFIIDIYGGKRLDDLEHVERTLVDCVNAAGATLLHVHLHPFEPNGGISGVAVLAESHISIHSWPEREYAALDIFMCGNAKPERCLGVLEKAFDAQRMAVREILRGKDAAHAGFGSADSGVAEADLAETSPAEADLAETSSAEADLAGAGFAEAGIAV